MENDTWEVDEISSCCDATVFTTAGENKSVCGHRQSVGGFGTELDTIDRKDES